VKKITAIFFLAVYLFSTTEANQLLKLPVIFQHFQEHKQENKNITFLDFLAMHYLHGSPKDEDYDRDMQLPFKTSDNIISSITTAFVPLIGQFSIARQIKISEKKKYVTQNQFILSSCLSKIWHPPKSC